MSKKKILKVGLIVLGSVLLILFVLQSYIHRQIDQLVKAKITEALGEGYKADYQKSKIGFLQKSITLKEVEVSKHNDSLEFWNGQIGELKVHGFHALKLLKGEGISIDSITIDRPKFNLLAFDSDTPKAKTSSDSLSIDSDTELAISVIRIKDGSFLMDPDGPESLAFNIHLLLKDLSLSEIKKQQIDLLDHIDLSIENFVYQFPDSVYSIQAEKVTALSNEPTFNATNINVKSNLTKEEYPKHYGWQKVKFDIEIPDLAIDRPTSISKDSLIVPKIIVNEVTANLEKDKNYPLPNRHTELPQYGMAKLGLKLRCDSVLIRNGQLQFEATQSTGEIAQVQLTEIEGAVIGFQNIDTLLPAFTLKAHSQLQGEANVELESVYTYGALDPFTLKGSLGNTDLHFMDDFLMKMIGLKIKGGSLTKLDFDMYGNTYGVNGFVDFYYDNLEIHAVDKDTGEDKKVINFITGAVGGLVFWHENPADDQFRRGRFNVERDVRKGFISQWMDGLLFGIMDSVAKVDPSKVKQTSKSIRDRLRRI